ncbi:MAG: YIP1 family protein [Bacteroidales bacterium]|nr:YIP1 family protein [Bacteroidales bacterium]MDT8431415.1 YIP1 family protein [Bacteroidales bacterium]
MDVKRFFIRSKNLLLSPTTEFKRISEEDRQVVSINKRYVTTISLFVALLALIGSVFTHISAPINSFLYVLINTVIVFLLMITHIYLSGRTITFLGRNIAANDRDSNFYALSAYAQLPFFLALGLIKLFPSLIFLIFIGFYSVLLFHTGTSMMTRIPSGKRIQFTALSILIMITSFIICSELYTLLYSEIIREFSTFAAVR